MNKDDLNKLVNDILHEEERHSPTLEIGCEARYDLKSSQPIPAMVSNRHIHLKQETIELLFGKGYRLERIRSLGQPGEFVSQAEVTIATMRDAIPSVRVLGPPRSFDQVELSRTDGYRLGISPPVRLSGNIKGSESITLIGPKGSIYLKEGAIVAARHIHLTPYDAKQFQVKDKELVSVLVPGDRPLIFDDVIVRVNESFALEFHIDQDEANAAHLNNHDQVYIVERKVVCDRDEQPAKKKAEKPKPTDRIKASTDDGMRAMGFISEADVRKAIKDKAKLYIDKTTIITALARELGTENDIFVMLDT